MLNWERHWYHPTSTLFSKALWPFSVVFRTVVMIRKGCYRLGLKKTHHFSIPIIVVGNITVGGTGKTPFVIWLAEFLKTQGLKPGIISRGVGGREARSPQWVDSHSDPWLVGDEAVLIAKRTNCPVVVAPDRVASVNALLQKSACDIIISDDGLQHYRLGRQIEIAMIDGDRRFGNQHFLPAGPLRESPSRLKSVDFKITQGVALADEHSMLLQGDELISLKKGVIKKIRDLTGQTVHAVAAIGNPERFFQLLRQEGLTLIEHRFRDHYHYQKKDLAFADNLPIIMTEKDAVKCQHFADDKFWYVSVNALLTKSFEEKLANIINVNII